MFINSTEWNIRAPRGLVAWFDLIWPIILFPLIEWLFIYQNESKYNLGLAIALTTIISVYLVFRLVRWYQKREGISPDNSNNSSKSAIPMKSIKLMKSMNKAKKPKGIPVSEENVRKALKASGKRTPKEIDQIMASRKKLQDIKKWTKKS